MKRLSLLFFSLLLLGGCQRADITTSGSADDKFYLRVKGFNLPVHVAGNLDSRKMLVLLHGGPGGNSSVYRNNTVKNTVEPQFAVVYLDQRSAGATQGNGSESDLEDFRDDIRKLVLLLREKYGEDQQIYLLGHSWGGFLAPYFLLEHQNLVQGWIQVGGAHRGNFNSLVKDMLIEYGTSSSGITEDPSFWQSAVDYCNSSDYQDNSFDSMIELNQLAHEAESNITGAHDTLELPDINVFSPILTELLNQLNSNLVYGFFEKFHDRNPVTPRLADINTPALLLWGKYDFVCPPALSDELLASISSTDVTRIIYDNSGHSPMINRPVSFWNDVATWVNNH